LKEHHFGFDDLSALGGRFQDNAETGLFRSALFLPHTADFDYRTQNNLTSLHRAAFLIGGSGQRKSAA